MSYLFRRWRMRWNRGKNVADTGPASCDWLEIAAAMFPIHVHIGRVLIACAAVVGQFIPASAVSARGKSCCSATASRSCCKSILSAG